jgi:predicted nucleic acid-binding protein
MSAAGNEPLVFDTSAVLNFGHRGGLRELLVLLRQERRLLVTPQVVAEIRDPQQAVFYRELLTTLFETVPVPDVPGLVWETALDDGEKSILALSYSHCPHYTAVVDEILGRAEARRLGVPITGTLGLLKHAVERTWLTKDAALAAIHRMRQGGFRTPRPGANDTLAEFLRRLAP